jgi:transcriptional regulator with XRE-family HTH domain
MPPATAREAPHQQRSEKVDMTRNDGEPQATLRGRILGTELRRVREASGLTIAELAARSGQSPDTVRQLEKGVTDPTAPDPTLWCTWGTLATSMVNILCRTSERIDIFAPLGIHPALEQLDADRCTAYVLEQTPVDRRDVTIRVIPRDIGLFPGTEYHPLTRFTMPDGPAVIFYAYMHAANFTEETQHLLSAYTLFAQLAEFTGRADLT